MKTIIIVRTVMLLGVLIFLGCLMWPKHQYGPSIPGHHWNCDLSGCTLYDGKGVRVASIIGTIFATGDGAQACIFESPYVCKTFENDQQAFAFVDEFYAATSGEGKAGEK